MLWIGMFIGCFIGAISIAILAAGASDHVDVLDKCERCKTAMCESCDIHKRYEIVTADNKALEEANATLKKRCYQLNGIAERLQRKLDYQNRIIKVA